MPKKINKYIELEPIMVPYFNKLDELDKKIAILYNGFFNEDKHSYQEIGEIVNLSKSQVSRRVMKINGYLEMSLTKDVEYHKIRDPRDIIDVEIVNKLLKYFDLQEQEILTLYYRYDTKDYVQLMRNNLSFECSKVLLISKIKELNYDLEILLKPELLKKVYFTFAYRFIRKRFFNYYQETLNNFNRKELKIIKKFFMNKSYNEAKIAKILNIDIKIVENTINKLQASLDEIILKIQIDVQNTLNNNRHI